MTQLSTETLIREPVTHIVSLGPRCATSYNLRRYFNYLTAYPMDWWISDEMGTAAFLADNMNLDTLYDPDFLEEGANYSTVVHRTFRIKFHHEFPRNEKIPGNPVIVNYKDHISKPRQRTQYLVNRLRSLNTSSERILFVRECAEPMDPSDYIIDISKHLTRLFSDAEWALALIKLGDDPSTTDWRGTPAFWDPRLAVLNARLDQSRHKPFAETGSSHLD